MRLLVSVLLLSVFSLSVMAAEELQVVQIYTDNQLLDLIKENKHLSQVVIDECQLNQDIEARAATMAMPSYQFLWGDMLAYGVCVKKDIKLGLYYMQEAANQGLPEALEQLGRYYHIGKFFQPDLDKAITYLREAAVLNNLNAQLRLGEIYSKGQGSPLDYPELYALLHQAVTDNKDTHKKISQILTSLETKMPPHVIAAAKKMKF